MRHRATPVGPLGWALLTPPYGATIQDPWLCTGCGDPGHVFIAQASGDDEKWSDMQMSRCFPEERVGQGWLRPGE